MFDCTTDKYGHLYARWLTRPRDLVDKFEGPLYGKNVLDLAGGTGAISREIIHDGCAIELFDLNPRPDRYLLECVKQGRVRVRSGNALEMTHNQVFDVVFMRQALGYFPLEPLFGRVRKALKPGGSFVFNTFIRPRWHLKAYNFAGHWYLEAGGWFGSHVVHLQASPGIGADLTKFWWHKPEAIRKALRATGFTFTEELTAKSAYYVCKSP